MAPKKSKGSGPAQKATLTAAQVQDLIKRFPAKPGEDARAFNNRIREELAKVSRAAERKILAGIKKASDAESIKEIKEQKKEAAKIDRQKRDKPLQARTSSVARGSSSANGSRMGIRIREEREAARYASPFKLTRVQAMRAQTILSKGLTPEKVASRIKIPIDQAQLIYRQRLSAETFKDIYHAKGKIDGKGRVRRYVTPNQNDPNIKNSAEYKNGSGAIARKALKPGSVSTAGLAPGEAGFRLPSAVRKGAKIT